MENENLMSMCINRRLLTKIVPTTVEALLILLCSPIICFNQWSIIFFVIWINSIGIRIYAKLFPLIFDEFKNMLVVYVLSIFSSMFASFFAILNCCKKSKEDYCLECNNFGFTMFFYYASSLLFTMICTYYVCESLFKHMIEEYENT